MKPRIQLAVSIDAEEDNWTPSRTGVTVENIRALAEHHQFLRGLGLRPTYFVNHAVASDPDAANVIRDIVTTGGCEVGAHLHPWNTPPMDEPMVGTNTMMKNLPRETQQAKLEVLCEALHGVLEQYPTAFRAGRFGLGSESVRALSAMGFLVDSSVTPFISWQEADNGPDYRGAPQHCYRIAGGVDPAVPARDGSLCEVPISTGFTRRPFGWRYKLYSRAATAPLRSLKLGAVLAMTGLARWVMGSPEIHTAADLSALSRALIREGATHLLLVWHSPSLVPGFSPFTRTEEDRCRLHRRIADFVESLGEHAEIEAKTVSEVAARSRAGIPKPV